MCNMRIAKINHSGRLAGASRRQAHRFMNNAIMISAAIWAALLWLFGLY
jgi:hypothetical protein